jgi:hypothetical protein
LVKRKINHFKEPFTASVKLSEVCRLGGGGGGKEEEKLNV